MKIEIRTENEEYYSQENRFVIEEIDVDLLMEECYLTIDSKAKDYGYIRYVDMRSYKSQAEKDACLRAAGVMDRKAFKETGAEYFVIRTYEDYQLYQKVVGRILEQYYVEG